MLPQLALHRAPRAALLSIEYSFFPLVGDLSVEFNVAKPGRRNLLSLPHRGRPVFLIQGNTRHHPHNRQYQSHAQSRAETLQ